MFKNKILLGIMALVLVFSACQKEEPYDKEAQMKTDREILQKFIVDEKLTNVKESNGLFYQILKAGTGKDTVKLTDMITVNYTLKLLNGTTVDQSTDATFKPVLNSVIVGWQKGIPLITEGGQIRLLIPSPMGYANYAVGPIPANSPLDFTISLIKVN
jgi:FKBP-type peptidyl-prolyl cis-trans isomerase FkpA